MSTYWKCANIRTKNPNILRGEHQGRHQARRLTRATRRAHYPKEALLFISMKTRLQLIRGVLCFHSLAHILFHARVPIVQAPSFFLTTAVKMVPVHVSCVLESSADWGQCRFNVTM